MRLTRTYIGLFLICALATWLLTTGSGCVSLDKEAVQVLSNQLRVMAANGEVTLRDPAIEAYIFTEQGVAVRLKGVDAHAEAEGEGVSDAEPTVMD